MGNTPSAGDPNSPQPTQPPTSSTSQYQLPVQRTISAKSPSSTGTSQRSGFDAKSSSFYTPKSSTQLKILIRGGPESGKTSLFRALQGLEFDPQYTPTDQLQISHVPWTPQSSTNHLSAQEFLQRSAGNTISTQFKINPRVDVEIGVDVELVDCIDNGKRPVIPAHKLPNKKSLPPNIDCIDGIYYSPAVDSTTIDVWKNANVVLLCIDPHKVETYHYAVTVLQSIPQNLLQQGLSVVICLIRRDEPVVDRKVTDHMISMLAQGTSLKVISISSKNGYGIDKLRHFLLIPYLVHQSNEFSKLAEIYRNETQVVATFMTQLLIHDDYHTYIHTNQADMINDGSGGLHHSGAGDDFIMSAPKLVGANRFDDLDNELDDLTAKNSKANKNGAKLKSPSGWDDDDFDLSRGKNTTSGNKNDNTGGALKITNTQSLSEQRKNQNAGLDDFFGAPSGNGSFFDAPDDIIPVAKPKRKKKKAEAEEVDFDTNAKKAVISKKSTQTAPSAISNGFFDDDLDLEPSPVQKRVTSKASKAQGQTAAQTSQKSQPQAFGGFFDDDDDPVAPVSSRTKAQSGQNQQSQQFATESEQLDEELPAALLRPSSSQHIDEKAELAFFEDDVIIEPIPEDEQLIQPLQTEAEQHAPHFDEPNETGDDLFDETNSLLNSSLIDEALDGETEAVVGCNDNDDVATAEVHQTTENEHDESPADEPVVVHGSDADFEFSQGIESVPQEQDVQIVTEVLNEEQQPEKQIEESESNQIDDENVENAEDGDFEEAIEGTDDEDVVQTTEIEQQAVQSPDNADQPEVSIPIQPLPELQNDPTPPKVEADQKSAPLVSLAPKGGFYGDDEDDVTSIPAKKTTPQSKQTPQHSPQIKSQLSPSPSPQFNTKPIQKGFFDDDEDETIVTPKQTKAKQNSTPKLASTTSPSPPTPQLSPAPQSTPKVQPQSSSIAGFFDDDDIIPVKKPAKSPQIQVHESPAQKPKTGGFFCDSDNEDDAISNTKVPIRAQKPPQVTSTSSPFEFDDDNDTTVVAATTKKKKVVSKKQTELEKQMQALKLEEEKKKQSEENSTGFTFKARASGGSFYD